MGHSELLNSGIWELALEVRESDSPISVRGFDSMIDQFVVGVPWKNRVQRAQPCFKCLRRHVFSHFSFYSVRRCRWSELHFPRSLRFDFRRNALGQLLEEYTF